MAQARLPRPSVAIGRRGAIGLAVTLAALSIAARLFPGQLDWVDGRLADLVNSPRYLEFFRDVSQLGSTEVTVAVAALGSLIVWKRCRALAVLYPTAVLGGLVLNVVLKVAIGRSRPPESLTGTALDSFPSGHTIQAVIALGMLPAVLYALTGRRAVSLAASGLTAMSVVGVGISRVVLGAHWPTDIVGGILVGVLVLLAAEQALEHMPTRWVPGCTGCSLHRAWGLAHET